ncbi:MAG: hypothetical protein ACI4OK_02480, partial [Selenomonas bovis]
SHYRKIDEEPPALNHAFGRWFSFACARDSPGGHSLMFPAAGVRKRNTLTQIDVCARVNVSIDINVKGADMRSALLTQTKGGRLYAGTAA